VPSAQSANTTKPLVIPSSLRALPGQGDVDVVHLIQGVVPCIDKEMADPKRRDGKYRPGDQTRRSTRACLTQPMIQMKYRLSPYCPTMEFPRWNTSGQVTTTARARKYPKAQAKLRAERAAWLGRGRPPGGSPKST